MDKKKIKELIIQAEILFDEALRNGGIDVYKNRLRAEHCFKDAIEELSKSDWISVEDELPKYDEDVWVRSNKSPKNVGTTYRHKECKGGYGSDQYGFPSELGVTHWHKIEKLEE